MRIKILSPEFDELGEISDVISAELREGLNSFKELQFSTILTPEVSELIVDNIIAEVDDDYYDIAYFEKAQYGDGTLRVSAEFEHVSYRLNNPEYDMEYFTEIGTPAEVLGKILAGTDFTVGTVEFTETVTFSIQEKSSRRKMLMEFVSYLGGEVDFNKFEISIMEHRGSTIPKDITEGRNFEIIAVSFDKRQKDDEGNALVAYTCKLIRPMDINLGDVVTMRYGTLGIDTSLRVVSVTTNPYNTFDVEFEIGNFNSTLENDIYRIETSAVAKDKFYNGCRIGPEFGFEAIRNDKKARAYFRSDGLAIQSGDGSGDNWQNKIHINNEGELIISGASEDGYTRLTDSGIKVFDDNDSLRVHLGQLEPGKFGLSIITKNQQLLINEYGIDPRFIKNYKNVVMNSSFERFDSLTKKPALWSGGESTSSTSFFGTNSMMLDVGESSEMAEDSMYPNVNPKPDPSWWGRGPTRVSFYHKFGACQMQVFNTVTWAPCEMTLPDGTIQTYLNTTYDDQWKSYTVSIDPGESGRIWVRYTNIDTVPSAIDAVQIEPDFTGRWPSFYTDDPFSVSPNDGILSGVWAEFINIPFTQEVDIEFNKAYKRAPSVSVSLCYDLKADNSGRTVPENEIVFNTDLLIKSVGEVKEYYGCRIVACGSTPSYITNGYISVIVIGRE